MLMAFIWVLENFGGDTDNENKVFYITIDSGDVFKSIRMLR